MNPQNQISQVVQFVHCSSNVAIELAYRRVVDKERADKVFNSPKGQSGIALTDQERDQIMEQASAILQQLNSAMPEGVTVEVLTAEQFFNEQGQDSFPV